MKPFEKEIRYDVVVSTYYQLDIDSPTVVE